jgi:hypothetical protein
MKKAIKPGDMVMCIKEFPHIRGNLGRTGTVLEYIPHEDYHIFPDGTTNFSTGWLIDGRWMSGLVNPSTGDIFNICENDFVILPADHLIVISPGDLLENIDTKIKEPVAA